MNYIKQLQEQSLEQADRIEALEQGIIDIMRYINSDKFREGELQGYVNVKDIALRLNELRGDFFL